MSANLMKRLHAAAEQLAEADPSEFAELFSHISALLQQGGPDARSEAWTLSIPHLFVDCLLLPLRESDVLAFSALLPMLADFAHVRDTANFNEIEV